MTLYQHTLRFGIWQIAVTSDQASSPPQNMSTISKLTKLSVDRAGFKSVSDDVHSIREVDSSIRQMPSVAVCCRRFTMWTLWGVETECVCKCSCSGWLSRYCPHIACVALRMCRWTFHSISFRSSQSYFLFCREIHMRSQLKQKTTTLSICALDSLLERTYNYGIFRDCCQVQTENWKQTSHDEISTNFVSWNLQNVCVYTLWEFYNRRLTNCHGGSFLSVFFL